MNYKKILTAIISSSVLLFMTFFIMIVFSACNKADREPKMYIEMASLTEEENNIITLLGAKANHHIYDIKADDTIKSIQVNTYELKDGVWHRVEGGGSLFNDNQGRLALSFEILPSGLQFGVLSKNSGGSTKTYSEIEDEYKSMSYATSMLNTKTEIIYEKEIPIAIQILTTKSSFRTYGVESFYTPEDFMNLGYEHVYAVSVLFSQKTN